MSVVIHSSLLPVYIKVCVLVFEGDGLSLTFILLVDLYGLEDGGIEATFEVSRWTH